jgi:hypothetical protein
MAQLTPELIQRLSEAIERLVERMGDSSGKLSQAFNTVTQASQQAAGSATRAKGAFDRLVGSTYGVDRAIDQLNNRAKDAGSAFEKSTRLGMSERAIRQAATQDLRELQRAYSQDRISRQELLEATEQYKRRLIASVNDPESKAATARAVNAAEELARADNSAAVTTERFDKVLKAITPSMNLLGSTIGGVVNSIQDPNFIRSGTGLLTTEMKTAAGATSMAGKGIGALGDLVSARSRGLGGALKILGLSTEAAGAVLGKLPAVVELISRSTQDYVTTFKQANQAGATFTAGMEEMRHFAGKAGVGFDTLTAGVAGAAQEFNRGGLSFTQAYKGVASYGKELLKGEQATRLFALGFTEPAERIKLAGQAFEMARIRGMSVSDAMQNISGITMSYAKDLKELEAIAGKQAADLMRKSQEEQLRYSLQNKLGEEGSAIYNKFYTAMEKFGPMAGKAQLALAQAANDMPITVEGIAENPAMKRAIEQMAARLHGPVEGALSDFGSILDNSVKDMERDGTANRVQQALLAGGGRFQDAMLQTVADFRMGAINASRALDPKNLQRIQDSVTGIVDEGKVDETTRTLAGMQQDGEKVRALFQQLATESGPINLFAGMVDKSREALAEMIPALQNIIKIGNERGPEAARQFGKDSYTSGGGGDGGLGGGGTMDALKSVAEAVLGGAAFSGISRMLAGGAAGAAGAGGAAATGGALAAALDLLIPVAVTGVVAYLAFKGINWLTDQLGNRRESAPQERAPAARDDESRLRDQIRELGSNDQNSDRETQYAREELERRTRALRNYDPLSGISRNDYLRQMGYVQGATSLGEAANLDAAEQGLMPRMNRTNATPSERQMASLPQGPTIPTEEDREAEIENRVQRARLAERDPANRDSALRNEAVRTAGFDSERHASTMEDLAKRMNDTLDDVARHIRSMNSYAESTARSVA